MKFFTALKFLTIFPAPASHKDGPEQLGQALAYFPLTGLIIGIVLSGASYLFHFFLPVSVTAALLIVLLVIMTGAHHLDGLMDTCDGMVAGRTREQRLTIMSDTRVGTFGIAGACLAILLKYSVLTSNTGMALLLTFPTLSRWALTGAILIFPSARESGSGYATRQSARWSGFFIATLIALVVSVLCCGLLQGPLIMLGLAAMIYGLGSLLKVVYGGLTGDSYGALVETGDILAMLLFIIINYYRSLLPGPLLLVFP